MSDMVSTLTQSREGEVNQVLTIEDLRADINSSKKKVIEKVNSSYPHLVTKELEGKYDSFLELSAQNGLLELLELISYQEPDQEERINAYAYGFKYKLEEVIAGLFLLYLALEDKDNTRAFAQLLRSVVYAFRQYKNTRKLAEYYKFSCFKPFINLSHLLSEVLTRDWIYSVDMLSFSSKYAQDFLFNGIVMQLQLVRYSSPNYNFVENVQVREFIINMQSRLLEGAMPWSTFEANIINLFTAYILQPEIFQAVVHEEAEEA